MTDSWTDDEPIDEVRQAFEEGTKDPRLGDEIPKLQLYPEPPIDKVQADIARREQLRTEELERLTKLQSWVQKAIDHGEIEPESGVTMLLNISKARMALAGVGYYPGAW